MGYFFFLNTNSIYLQNIVLHLEIAPLKQKKKNQRVGVKF